MLCVLALTDVLY